MPGGGKLSIDCSRVDREERSWALVKVSDTGVGIPPENQTKIFQADYTTKPNHEGVGLWWTHAYVKGLEGKLEVESSVGQGTTFTVVLPASSKLNQKADAPISEAEE